MLGERMSRGTVGTQARCYVPSVCDAQRLNKEVQWNQTLVRIRELKGTERLNGAGLLHGIQLDSRLASGSGILRLRLDVGGLLWVLVHPQLRTGESSPRKTSREVFGFALATK